MINRPPNIFLANGKMPVWIRRGAPVGGWAVGNDIPDPGLGWDGPQCRREMAWPRVEGLSGGRPKNRNGWMAGTHGSIEHQMCWKCHDGASVECPPDGGRDSISVQGPNAPAVPQQCNRRYCRVDCPAVAEAVCNGPGGEPATI